MTLSPTEKPQYNCARCKERTDNRMVCNNHRETFSKMKKDERMHIECYIELCIDEYLKEKS